MSSLGTKFTSKHLKSSRDTSPYRFTPKLANFTHRDPHPENVKFDSNLRRFARRAKQCRHLKSVVGGGGLKGVGSSFASALPRNCKAERNLSPSPLLRKEAKLATLNLTKPNLAFLRCGSRCVNLKFARKICLKRHFFVAVIVADML